VCLGETGRDDSPPTEAPLKPLGDCVSSERKVDFLAPKVGVYEIVIRATQWHGQFRVEMLMVVPSPSDVMLVHGRLATNWTSILLIHQATNW
jgi:hypothetical protein